VFGTSSAVQRQECEMNISVEKLLIVCGFLLILFAIQIFLKFRSASGASAKRERAEIKVVSRLNLSSKDRVELLEIGDKSLLIVFSKNAQPNVFELSSTLNPIEESANL
jgi:flagellar biogenesis protein FliO